MKVSTLESPKQSTPRPRPVHLRLLRAILDEAREVKDPHWSHDYTLCVLADAQTFIDEGDWRRSLDCAKKAETNQGRYGKLDHGERYHALLRELKEKYDKQEKVTLPKLTDHDSFGGEDTMHAPSAAKLKAEIEEKKETPHVSTKQVPAARVHKEAPDAPALVPASLAQGEPGDPGAGVRGERSPEKGKDGAERSGGAEALPVSVPSGTSGGRASGEVEPTTDDDCVVPGCNDKQSVYGDAPLCPEHRRQGFTPEMCDELDPPCSDCKTIHRDRSACPLCGKILCLRCAESVERGTCCDEKKTATSSPRTEPEPHPFAVAATRIELIKAYWGAIAAGVKADIILLTKQCKHVGLEEVYQETVWQLANRELHPAHKRARQIAVEAWEGMVME